MVESEKRRRNKEFTIVSRQGSREKSYHALQLCSRVETQKYSSPVKCSNHSETWTIDRPKNVPDDMKLPLRRSRRQPTIIIVSCFAFTIWEDVLGGWYDACCERGTHWSRPPSILGIGNGEVGWGSSDEERYQSKSQKARNFMLWGSVLSPTKAHTPVTLTLPRIC
jgi:hypothetical protein